MGQKKISIVGANSFLAQNLIEELLKLDTSLSLLARENRVNSPEITFTAFDYPGKPLSLEAVAQSDVIIYAAGAGVQAGGKEPTELIYQINAHIPTALLLYLEEIKYPGKIITFGSYFELGQHAEARPYKEEELIGALSPVPNHYCSSKRLLSRFVANGLLNIQYYHLILPTIYGPGESLNRLIPYVVRHAREGQALTLTSGEQSRSYLYVKDLVHLLIEIIHSDFRPGLINVGPGEQIKIKELVQLIGQVLDKPLTLKPDAIIRADTAMQHLELDAANLSSLTCWSPKKSLKDIIPLYY